MNPILWVAVVRCKPVLWTEDTTYPESIEGGKFRVRN